MVIFVTSDDESNSNVRKLEDISFKDERVGIGSKFFRCIKISEGDAAQDRLLKKAGKATPRLVFLKRNYEVVAVLERRSLSASKINKAMAKLAKTEYKSSYRSMLSKYAKLLNELDRLDDKRTKLAADEARYASNPRKYKSKQKKFLKEKAKFDQEMDAWRKAEAALLEFKLKNPRPAAT